MGKAIISKDKYDYLVECKKNNQYANHICDVKTRLGSEKIFKVEGTDKKIKMRCSNIGGLWAGSHAYRYVSDCA